MGACLDQASKYGVFSWLGPRSSTGESHTGEFEIVPGVFQLHAQFDQAARPQVNHGALFGWLSHYNNLANGFFAVVSVAAAVAIITWSVRRSTARDGALCAALGLILAGTLGNLYDRIVFDGVRDFLYFYWIEWPVFNIADCCLVCGAFLLLAQAFLSRPMSTQYSLPRVAMSPEAVEAK